MSLLLVVLIELLTKNHLWGVGGGGAVENICIIRKGWCTTESNYNDYSSPYPCKACETKGGKNTDSTLIFFLSFFYLYYIMSITIIWQNLGGREGTAYAP